MEAARLTGDPQGLAMALKRIENYQSSLFKKILFAAKDTSEPSLLRTHPKVTERVERLLSIQVKPIFDYQTFNRFYFPAHYRRLIRRPRWHVGGFWY